MISNLLLYLLYYYAEACNKFQGLITTLLCQGNTASFKGMLQRWQAVGNTVFDLTGLRFEPQTFLFSDERVAAQPTGQ